MLDGTRSTKSQVTLNKESPNFWHFTTRDQPSSKPHCPWPTGIGGSWNKKSLNLPLLKGEDTLAERNYLTKAFYRFFHGLALPGQSIFTRKRNVLIQKVKSIPVASAAISSISFSQSSWTWPFFFPLPIGAIHTNLWNNLIFESNQKNAENAFLAGGFYRMHMHRYVVKR